MAGTNNPSTATSTASSSNSSSSVATSAVDVGAVVAPTSSNSQQIQQLGPFRTHVGDEEEVLVGAPGLDNGHGLQLVGVHHEDEDSPRARYNRSALNPALYHHNPHHGQSIHACDPLGDPDYQDGCLDQHPVRFHRDEYAHQYSPQSRSNGDWPGQHLGNQIPQWIDGRAGAVWHPPPVPMGPNGTDQRFVVGNQSHMKWMEQSRPGSAMSNTGSGKMKGVGSRSLLYEPMASDCIPDDQLAQLSVKELNKRVQNLTRDDIVKLKQRRRTLKNRGYAMNCRLRRQMHKEGLESQLNDMRDRFYNALKERDAVIKERDYLRNQLNQLEKLQASGGLVGPTTSNNGGSAHHDALQLSLAHSSHHPGHHHAGQLDLSLNGNDGSHNYKRSPNTYGSLAAIHHQENAKLMSYKCDTGFEFSNGATESTITCGSNGEWTPTISECVRITCGPPTLPEGNKLFSNYDANNPPKEGDNIEIHCSPGYHFRDDTSQFEFIATCKLKGEDWEYTNPSNYATELPSCVKAAFCPVPPPIPDGVELRRKFNFIYTIDSDFHWTGTSTNPSATGVINAFDGTIDSKHFLHNQTTTETQLRIVFKRFLRIHAVVIIRPDLTPFVNVMVKGLSGQRMCGLITAASALTETLKCDEPFIDEGLIIYRTDSPHTLSISEVQVEAEGTFKPDDTTFLESQLIPRTASASSGDNPNGIFDGVPFTTDLEANPWWKVDFERYMLITAVHLEVEAFKPMEVDVLTPSPLSCKKINLEADLLAPCSSILEGIGLQIRGPDPDPMKLHLLKLKIGTIPLGFEREFSQRDIPSDCAESYASGGFLTPGEELHSYGTGSTIASTKSVFCDRGWNVILRRGQFGNPSDYFDQDMDNYKSGFGDKNKEFWLGLDYLFHLTNARDYRLKIELWDTDLNYRQANYGRFKILNNVTYDLEVGDFSSPSHAFVLDAFGTANGMKFTTKDFDNDEDTTENCAKIYEGPGWFKGCGDANVFGPNYNTKKATSHKAMFWRYFQGPTNSLSKIVMSITSSMTEPVAGTTASEAILTEVASDLALEYRCIKPEQSFVALKEFSFIPLTTVSLTCSKEGVWNREPANPVPCEDTFCTIPPEPPAGSFLKLYDYQGFPIVKDEAATFKFICEDGKIMTPFSGSGSLSIFEVPCPFNPDSITWPSCQSSKLCPALMPPPTSPQQGHVNLTDNGIKFGPCFGRSTISPVALPSCPAIKVFVEDQEILASGQFKSKVHLMITTESSDLNSKITFSHELQPSSSMDITNGATLEDSPNLRTKVLKLTNLEPGLIEKHSIVFLYDPVPGLDLCVYDAICSDSQTEMSTNSSLTNNLDVTAGNLGTKAMVRYSCGSATEFEKDAATEKFVNLECLMDGNWNDSITLPPCVYVKCDVPPVNPGLSIWNWDGQPVPFDSAIQYRCENGKKFQHDPSLDFVEATCRPGNSWEAPVGGWPTCIETQVCEDPPAKVEGGEREILSTGYRYGVTCVGANGVEEMIPGQNTCNSPTIALSKTFFYSNGIGEQMERSVYTIRVKTPNTVPKITSILKFSIPPEHALEITGAVNTKLIPTKADTVFILQADLDISFAPNNSISLIMDSKVGDSPACLVEMQCSPCEEASDCQATIDNYHSNLVKLVGGNIFKSSYNYKCPIGWKFVIDGNPMASLNISCFWNQTWQPFAKLPTCAPFGCANPILPPSDKNLNLTNYQSDQVVDFGFEAIFQCSDGFLFEEDQTLTDVRAVCNPNGTWSYPQWKQCVNPSTRYCPDPMASPPDGGLSDWNPALSGKAVAGKQVTYTCSEAQDLRDSNDVVIPEFVTTCQWNQTWVPQETLTCKWNACINPPLLPNMKASYLGKPVAFGANVVYTCESGFYFSDDKEKASISTQCLPDGSFDKSKLTFCVDTMYCLTEPPKAPIGGRRIWNGDIEFEAISTYTCGPNKVFLLDDNSGSTAKSLTSTCQWNTNWDRIELPLCIATGCSKLPKPPTASNLVYLSSSQFKVNTNPDEMFYNLTVPNSLPLPANFGTQSKMMLVAHLKDNVEQNPVLQFVSDNNDIGFHLEVDLANENLDLTNDFIPGTNHHQFVIDEGDTFQIQITFKPENFVFDIQLNEELSTEFQATPAMSPITKLLIQGDFIVSELKFLTSDQVSTVPIGSILEFGCEGGRVFSHNWMIRPIVQTTCNKDGSFYEPTPWPSCVLPTTTVAPSTTPCANETGCNSNESKGSGCRHLPVKIATSNKFVFVLKIQIHMRTMKQNS